MQLLVVNCVNVTGLEYPGGHPGEWFRKAAGGDPARFAVWHVHRQETPPHGSYQGVILSGSPASAYQDLPWIARLIRSILSWAEEGTPMLGVCFGHQLLAQALGGKVERNPCGREIGTLPIHLTEVGRRDPLFEGLPERFDCMHGHSDFVSELPSGAEILAYSRMTPVQAFRLGERIRGIQFHPEFTSAIVKFILARDREALGREGLDESVILAQLREVPEARRVLANFERRFVQPRRPGKI